MDRLLAGDRAIGKLGLFSMAGLRSDRAGEVTELEVPPGWSRADAMAVAAAREAIADAGIDVTAGAALYLAGSTGGMFECEEAIAELKRDIDADVDRSMLAVHPLSAASDRIHRELGPFAHVVALCSACSGGATALGIAAEAIRHGRTRCAVAGGVDALCRLTYAGFTALGAVDSEPCRPFDAERAGLSLGEGAAFLVLESQASVEARGVEAIAELAGWSIASEAHHITHPEPSGATAARVMRAAIADAQLPLDDIDYLNAHGTATPHNDPMESTAIARCFGDHTKELWVSSTKGAIGHTLGAAGAIEAAIAAMSVQRGVIVPTAGLVDPDAACDLRHARQAQTQTVRAAMSNAFGFGGTDTVLVLCPPREGPSPRHEPRGDIVITGAASLGPLGLFGGDDLVGAAAYLEPGPLPADEPCDVPKGVLEMMRARRLDRASRMTTIATQRALGDTPRDGMGIVLGTAHGAVSATTHVIRRIFEKGPKYASPVHFPCVLPSAVASHPSIYLGLDGPAVACSDLSASGEAAFALASDMLVFGITNRVVAAAVDEHNELAAKVSLPVTCNLADRGARSEGAAALVLELASEAEDRALARVGWQAAWRGDMPALPPPGDDALLVLVRDAAAPGWESVPRRIVADRAGDHEAVGGLALVAAVAVLVRGDAAEVLVLGNAPDRGYAWVLRR